MHAMSSIADPRIRQNVSQYAYGTYLKEYEHKDGIGSEADEGRSPTAEKEPRTFFSQRAGQDAEWCRLSRLREG
jgi:hypothetical protein